MEDYFNIIKENRPEIITIYRPEHVSPAYESVEYYCFTRDDVYRSMLDLVGRMEVMAARSPKEDEYSISFDYYHRNWFNREMMKMREIEAVDTKRLMKYGEACEHARKHHMSVWNRDGRPTKIEYKFF